MDFPIPVHEMSARQISGRNPGRTGQSPNASAFSDLLSADRFSDMSDGASLDELYDDLDTLTSRDDRADEDPAGDDTDADRDSDDSGAENDGEDDDANGQSANSNGSLNPLLADAQQTLSGATTSAGASPAGAADPSAAQMATAQGRTPAGATSPQDQLSAALAGNPAPGTANLAEARVMNKRTQVLQVNEQHAATVKSQIAKAEGGAADATARAADATKAPTTPQETGQPKIEAGRLDQAFRAAFPQNTNPPAVTPTPASNQTPLATQAAPVTDSLTMASSSDGGDTNTQIQQNAERANNAATAKAAATRTPFSLPGSRPAEQVSVQIQNAARNGTDRISIRLSPAALGKVEVKLELSPDKTVQAIVTAEKPETLDMLERDARTLQRALEEAGLKTNSDSLSFERRDSGGTSDSASDSDGNAPNGTERSGNSENDDDSSQVDVELSNRQHHDGLLDVEV